MFHVHVSAYDVAVIREAALRARMSVSRFMCAAAVDVARRVIVELNPEKEAQP